MKVITLNDAEFNCACINLANCIAEKGDTIALVGIKTGGAVVATTIFTHLKDEDVALKYYEVSASRSTSPVKNTDRTKKVFKFAPNVILDWLRVFEHNCVRLRMSIFHTAERSIRLSNDLVEYLAHIECGIIYIIDDAIDSGATVNNLLAELNKINPKVEYKVAVLVVTQSNPLVTPDISLYENVLLRFPWSSDYKL